MNRRTFIRAATATIAVGAINKLAGTPTVAAETTPTPTPKVNERYEQYKAAYDAKSYVVGEHGPEIVITIPTAADQRAMQQAVIDAIKDYQRRGGTPKNAA